jgi:hypothetical protein
MLGGGAVATGELSAPAPACPAGLVVLFAGEHATRTTEAAAETTMALSGRRRREERGIRIGRITGWGARANAIVDDHTCNAGSRRTVTVAQKGLTITDHAAATLA